MISLISLTCVFSKIGDKSVALITATVSAGTSLFGVWSKNSSFQYEFEFHKVTNRPETILVAGRFEEKKLDQNIRAPPADCLRIKAVIRAMTSFSTTGYSHTDLQNLVSTKLNHQLFFMGWQVHRNTKQIMRIHFYSQVVKPDSAFLHQQSNSTNLITLPLDRHKKKHCLYETITSSRLRPFSQDPNDVFDSIFHYSLEKKTINKNNTEGIIREIIFVVQLIRPESV